MSSLASVGRNNHCPDRPKNAAALLQISGDPAPPNATEHMIARPIKPGNDFRLQFQPRPLPDYCAPDTDITSFTTSLMRGSKIVSFNSTNLLSPERRRSTMRRIFTVPSGLILVIAASLETMTLWYSADRVSQLSNLTFLPLRTSSASTLSRFSRTLTQLACPPDQANK